MNPTQTATVLMRALMKGDNALVEQCIKYTTHMVEVSSKCESYKDLQTHSIRCGFCFKFQMRSGGLIPIAEYWKVLEIEEKLSNSQSEETDAWPDIHSN